GIQDQQPRECIERVVKREIDMVHSSADVAALFDIARDPRYSPEARLFAGAKIEASWELAAADRRGRPAGIDLDLVRAATAGLNSAGWRHPFRYCSLLECGADDRAVERENPIGAN